MSSPGPFDAEFLDDLPYDVDVLLFDRLLEVDRDRSLVRCSWPTTAEQPFTKNQRTHPVRHPPHVSGALMVHATGMIGFVHAYHVLGLRHRQGWTGFGTHMDKVVFKKLVPPGERIEATCRALRSRIGQVRHFVRYGFEFRWRDEICYTSEQSAMWIQTGAEAPMAIA
jgi:3-hydroxymyristoyl/3-hydroxydecanoyl-(acyl carrier protein) dehydratase